jgi:hypothetical protein
MEIIHNNKQRMPLILDPENALNWLSNNLNKNQIKAFFKPFDASKMKARPIRKINPFLSDTNNNAGINVYYEYNELSELIKAFPHYFEQSVDLR